MNESFTPRPTVDIPPSIFSDEKIRETKILNIGQHRIVVNELIGLGCQGYVYAGTSNRHGSVAVKEIPLSYNDNIEIHYKAEMLGVGPIIFDIFSETGKTYIIMERLSRTLCLKDLSNPAINYKLCELVTILIENGIFHNDLRDTNIMFDKNGNLHIIDYESACLAWKAASEQDKLDYDVYNIPLLTEPEYNTYLDKNYHIYISGKKYVLNYDYILQTRHHKAYLIYMDLLLDGF